MVNERDESDGWNGNSVDMMYACTHKARRNVTTFVGTGFA